MLRPAESLDCRRAEMLLEAFVDEELSGSLIHAFERHLKDCPNCRGEVELARAIQDGLRQLELESAPSHIRKTVLIHAATHAQPHSRRWPWLAAAAALAALLLIPALLSPPWHPASSTPNTELEQAIQDSRLALALVASASRRAGLEIRNDSLSNHLVSQAVDHMLRPLSDVKPKSTKSNAGSPTPANTTPARS